MINQNPWEEVIVESQVWNPEELGIGAEIMGIYRGKEENVGQWNKNRYTLAIMVDDKCEEKYVYGTVDLDEKFKQIPVGYEVKIRFVKELPSRPPKKPFKKFKVYKRPVEPNKPEPTNENNVAEDPDEKDPLTMNPYDDPKARETIKDITDYLINEKGIPINDIDDSMIKKEAGLWYGKDWLMKKDYESVLQQLERKHIKG